MCFYKIIHMLPGVELESRIDKETAHEDGSLSKEIIQISIFSNFG